MPDSINSLKRGLQALALLNERTSLSANELSAGLNLPRTSARRVLDTLAEEGFIEKWAGDGRFRLTPMVKALSAGIHDESTIARVAEPLLARRLVAIGWRLTISTPSGTNMLVRVSTERLAGRSTDGPDTGLRTPMLHGTSGHVMLAFMSAGHRNRLLEILEKSPDPRQALARDRAALLASLNRVRRKGFAHRRHLEYPEAGVGVPIFHNGVIRACLLMSYAKSALTRQEVSSRYVPLLRELATEIELGALGYGVGSGEPVGYGGPSPMVSGESRNGVGTAYASPGSRK